MTAGKRSNPNLNGSLVCCWLKIRCFWVLYRSVFRLGCYLTVLIVCLGCSRDEALTADLEIPQQTLSTFSMRHTEGGVLKWTLIGDKAEFRLQTTLVQNPYVEIYEEGQVILRVTAENGEIIDQTQNLKFLEAVVATSQNGRLLSEEVHWINQDNRLYSPVECKILRGDSVIDGVNAVAHPNLKVIEMDQVKATLYKKDEKLDETELEPK